MMFLSTCYPPLSPCLSLQQRPMGVFAITRNRTTNTDGSPFPFGPFSTAKLFVPTTHLHVDSLYLLILGGGGSPCALCTNFIQDHTQAA